MPRRCGPAHREGKAFRPSPPSGRRSERAETGAIVLPIVECLSDVNAGEDIDILAKNKRFVRRFGSAKSCRIDKGTRRSRRQLRPAESFDCLLERPLAIAVVYPGLGPAEKCRHGPDREAFGIEVGFDLRPG